MKIVILLLFIILIFIINKNIFDTQETYQDYGNYKDTRGASGLSIESAVINDEGKLVFVLSNKSKITTTKSVLGLKGDTGKAGLSISKEKIKYDDATGNLTIELSDGQIINIGNIKGSQGESLKGKPGEPGPGIQKIEVDETTGNLIVTLNDDNETRIDAGNVRGERGEDCKNIPQGIIVAWAGTKENIPEGWAICDGNQGTPNLSSRFIIGSNNSNYKPGTVGGELTHTLKLNEIPNHKHKTPNMNNVKVDRVEANSNTLEEAVLSTDNSVNDNTGDIVNYSGATQPHNNMPPYFALVFIMKT